MSDDQQYLNNAVAKYSARGWQAQQVTLTAVQLRHPSGKQVYLTVDMARAGNLPELGFSSWTRPVQFGAILLGLIVLWIAIEVIGILTF